MARKHCLNTRCAPARRRRGCRGNRADHLRGGTRSNLKANRKGNVLEGRYRERFAPNLQCIFVYQGTLQAATVATVPTVSSPPSPVGARSGRHKYSRLTQYKRNCLSAGRQPLVREYCSPLPRLSPLAPRNRPQFERYPHKTTRCFGRTLQNSLGRTPRAKLDSKPEPRLPPKVGSRTHAVRAAGWLLR